MVDCLKTKRKANKPRILAKSNPLCEHIQNWKNKRPGIKRTLEKGKAVRPFIFENWHAWQSGAHILLSDEAAKKLRQFAKPDDAVNWLFLNQNKPAARALNVHLKGAT